ncbi:MAG: KpsF/GutQ family sugar-phosphate isomerase [Planctomycetota bacterium]
MTPPTPIRADRDAGTPPGGSDGPDRAHRAHAVFASDLLRRERDALDALATLVENGHAERFDRAVDILCSCAARGGTVLVSGLGKSGLIGAKISATLASLGIPSHSVHPSEAAHGDLGRFRDIDAAICLSFSGETEEVVNLAAVLHQDGLPIITMTGGDGSASSSLARLATADLRLGVTDEAGAPHFVAPTSSTTATAALGDALALAAARARGFTDEDFAKRHPGGALGNLLRPVADALRFVAGKNVPLIDDSVTVLEAQRRAAEIDRRPGAILLVDAASGRLTGIFTDSDLRRLVLRDANALAEPIAEVMTREPRTLQDSALIRDAVAMVRQHRQDEIPIVDEQHRPVGILDVQDLVTLKLIRGES